MKCPFCEHEAPPRKLHAHLGTEHGTEVEVEDRGATRVYTITCPTCGASHEQPIKPRLRDAGFLEEFSTEIRLVAFDMLINHMLAEHTVHAPTETEVDLPG